MILEEFLNEGTLVKHWSDQNVMLRQIETRAEYGEAIDIVPCPYTYEETDIVIEQPEELKDEETIEKKEESSNEFENPSEETVE